MSGCYEESTLEPMVRQVLTRSRSQWSSGSQRVLAFQSIIGGRAPLS